MGIRHLNKFLQQNCPGSIKTITLSELSGKRIAIDASIYMYRFIAENGLLENIYLMISLFRHHNIHPIFVFDGKPPAEKNAVIETRKQNKQKAENEYVRLETTITDSTPEVEKKEIKHAMDALKKKFIRIRDSDVLNVKKLIQSYGVQYMDASGEADELCAKLALKGKVYACVSEDMDMFVYGCPRVIRYLSLLNQSAIMYDMKGILSSLSMTMDEFRMICVISGTDYGYGGGGGGTGGIGTSNTVPTMIPGSTSNTSISCISTNDTNNNNNSDTVDKNTTPRAIVAAATSMLGEQDDDFNVLMDICGNIVSQDIGSKKEKTCNSKRKPVPRNIFNSIEYFKKYKDLVKNNQKDVANTGFFEWLETHSSYIDNICHIYSVEQMFDLHHMDCPELKKLIITNSPTIDKKGIVSIMTKEDFIFIDEDDDVEVVTAVSCPSQDTIKTGTSTSTSTNTDTDTSLNHAIHQIEHKVANVIKKEIHDDWSEFILQRKEHKKQQLQLERQRYIETYGVDLSSTIGFTGIRGSGRGNPVNHMNKLTPSIRMKNSRLYTNIENGSYIYSDCTPSQYEVNMEM